MAQRNPTITGVLCAIGSFLWWGFMPVYFKLIGRVAPMLVLGHRIVWTFLVFLLLALITRRVPDLRGRRALLVLLASAILLVVNWGVFIWAIDTGRVLQSSLGYFIVPLVNVALGVMILHERLRRWQIAALLLAAAGVAELTIARGAPPWIALALAFSFGVYGLLRKTVAVETIPGLCIETAFLLPLALVLIALSPGGTEREGGAMGWSLLILSGPVTAVPLLLFSLGARRLRLATMGFLQYLVPTCQFLLAVGLYGEPFRVSSAVGFALIWVALAIYSVDSWRGYRDGSRGGGGLEMASELLPE